MKSPRPDMPVVRALYLRYAAPGFIHRYRQWLHALSTTTSGSPLEVEIVTLDDAQELAVAMANIEDSVDYVVLDPSRPGQQPGMSPHQPEPVPLPMYPAQPGLS